MEGELYKGAPWKPRLRVIEGRAKHKRMRINSVVEHGG
jgi:hypothetical protein